jgi:hypothetical protein
MSAELPQNGLISLMLHPRNWDWSRQILSLTKANGTVGIESGLSNSPLKLATGLQVRTSTRNATTGLFVRTVVRWIR